MLHTWVQLGFIVLCLSGLQIVGQADSRQLPEQSEHLKQIKKQVSELILKLDSNQRAIRQQAETQLTTLGKPVLSLLPPPELITSNSVKEALQRIRIEIEKRAAQDSLKASHVDLKGAFSLKQVIKEITHQTGNLLDSGQLSKSILETRIEVDYVDVPFWKVIDDLSRQLKVSFQTNDSSGTLQLLKNNEASSDLVTANRQISYDGPFRTQIQNLQRRPLIGSPDRELLRATFLIQVEPRLRPLFLSYAAGKIKATGDTDLSLPPFNPGAKYEIPLGEGGQDLKFTMQWIREKQQKAKSVQIHGQLKMELAAETLPITFDDLFQSQGAIRRRGNVSVELISAEKKNLESSQNLTVRLALSYDYGGPAFESHRTWIYHNRAYLQDPQGKKYWLNGSSQTTLESAGKISVVYQFKNLKRQAVQYQFTYLSPTLITSTPIAFRFNQIALPQKVTKSR